MSPSDHELRTDPSLGGDPLMAGAISAARASYAPYTRGYAGVGLQMTDDSIVMGRYAENAAFNPSISPMASALALWRLAPSRDYRITGAALVQASARIDQFEICRLALAAVSDTTLRHFLVST
jgi:cytidine deaminase